MRSENIENKMRKEVLERSINEFNKLTQEKKMFAIMAIDLSIETLESVKHLIDVIIVEKKRIASEFVKIVSN